MSAAKQHRLAAGLGTLALLAWGCSMSAPTSPSRQVYSGTPSFVRVPGAGAGTFSSDSGLPDTSSAIIDGATGGTLSNGRFQLVIPPGAFTGTARLTLFVPDRTVVQCELGISPPEANRFARPVKLIADCNSGLNIIPARLETLWYDESRGLWVTVPGSVISGSTITTPLAHFSIYGIVDSKAGW